MNDWVDIGGGWYYSLYRDVALRSDGHYVHPEDLPTEVKAAILEVDIRAKGLYSVDG